MLRKHHCDGIILRMYGTERAVLGTPRGLVTLASLGADTTDCARQNPEPKSTNLPSLPLPRLAKEKEHHQPSKSQWQPSVIYHIHKLHVLMCKPQYLVTAFASAVHTHLCLCSDKHACLALSVTGCITATGAVEFAILLFTTRNI